ncbi:hypothetical protein GC090_17720 [Pantoea sp. JZ29]|uniref:hypothetical protein n=1 Tax=Pantoea sp. JZ29 TaxID=2654192 RepID=UPI002B4719C5|nr:hypothetical protein [Pantoea sp. JZ29]WRH22361.1 hypothetical protein GC090_17720 [Pantoea sp. JZ29]
MDLNGREYAVLTWMLIGFLLCLFYKPTRMSILDILLIIKNKAVVKVFLILVLWVFLEVVLLHQLGVWSILNLKSTLVWFVSYALLTIFEVVNVSYAKKYFRDKFKDNLKLSVLLTFLLELQSFSFFTEFLFFPVIFILSGMVIVGREKEETKRVSTFLCSVISLFVVFYFAHSIYISILSYKETFTWFNFTELLIPMMLSVIYMPFLYFLHLYVNYERNLVSLKLCTNNHFLYKEATKLAIIYFRNDIDALNIFVRDVGQNPFKSEGEIKLRIKKILQRKKLEANPPLVLPSEGWSPFLAKDFLLEKNITMNDYHLSFDTWVSSSKMIEIGENKLIKDNVDFSINGTENVARSLKVRAHINNMPLSNETRETIHEIADILILKSLGSEISLKFSLFDDFPNLIKYKNYKITTRKEFFVKKEKGFTFELVISIV